jgi:hypothetical protein
MTTPDRARQNMTDAPFAFFGDVARLERQSP